ncbi:hypothetical protein RUM43_014424 [Polyplax serrata]|uniref:Presequence protease, mitochondrial n=1 Tax=Polyplax serrata TaxID=468196 RepID=A0AAN8RZI4_POLSC
MALLLKYFKWPAPRRLQLISGSDKTLIKHSKSIVLKHRSITYNANKPATKGKINNVQSNSMVAYNVGDKISGFVVTEVEKIPEFQLTAIKLIHKATGGEYLHIDKDDSNNAFSVIFRTTPTNSTGLPHILEHTTLCGSQRFPCRDPFFKMLNRSLATFMNAMTAPDYTMYPFSTQNLKDYENLMSVYLDAVFHPMLNKSDFNQEGWRLEHVNPEDPTSPIIIKGVVYNEMKGVFADNQNIFEYALLRNILPSNTYGVCSGGDPMEIPSLTHEDLKNFHKNYYSPLNAKYYSYGNFPLESHLKTLSEQYLEKNNLKATDKVSTVVPSEKRWSKPMRKHITCRVDPLAADQNKQSCVTISVLCCSITDVEECLLLKVLADLLVSGPNSSFYKTLIEPNIGAGFSPVTGYESQTRDTFFTVGLQGVSDKDFDKIIQIYDETVDAVIRDGFDKKNLEAILHSIELNLKHQSSNFGLGLLFSVTPIWNHEGDIINYLKIETHIEKLKKNIDEDPMYLQNTVKKYLKDNKHKLILTMSPDVDYDHKEKEKEQELIDRKVKNLSEADKKQIFEEGLKLLALQKKDDKSCLPTLRVSDLRKDVEPVQMHEEKVENVSFHVIPQPTNGITYFRGLMTLGDLPEDMKPFLPLFATVSTKMGTKKRNYKEFDQLSTLKTGGLSLGTHFRDDTKNLEHVEESLSISSYCLNRNLNFMFELWQEIFEDMELSDVKRFETLVKAQAASLVNGVTDMGHHYAVLSAASLVSGSSLKKERSSGLTYVNFMKAIAQSNLSDVLSTMAQIKDKVMTRSRLRCSLNVVEGTQSQVLEQAANFIKNTQGPPAEVFAMENVKLSNPSTNGIFHVLPIPVSYTGKSVTTVPYEHEDCSAIGVLARLMTMKYLHPEIREKGGAYGGGVNLSASGLLNFFSYRDPNPVNSHAVYDEALAWLKRGDFTQEDVDEAKLGLFQSIDAPTPPGNKGMRWFLHGITDESLQRHRLRIMQVTKDKIIEVGDKYLGSANKNLVGRATIGPENKALTEDTEHKWTVIKQS